MKYTEIEMLFYSYIFMVIFLLPFVLYTERDTFKNISVFTTNTWTGLVLLTVFHNFLSMILFFTALKKLDAIQVALSNFLITFLGLPIAAIWLHEKLSVVSIGGGALILISTLAITVWEYRQVAAEKRLNVPVSS